MQSSWYRYGQGDWYSAEIENDFSQPIGEG
jgi:hypothetical protein